MEDLSKHQQRLIDLCKQRNYKFVEYMEVGTADSIDMRPVMLKLLSEVEKGLYDGVCVVDFDRLGRGDLGEQDRIKKAFQKSNTLIITPEKYYDLNNDEDDTFADLKGFLARQEYKQITKRFAQGKKIGARRGEWTNGTPPFPYVYERYGDKYNAKGLVVHDDKLIIYRQIINLALDGVTPNDIASQLNKAGLQSPRSRHWNGVGVYRLLIDETHLGRIISNKTTGDGHKVKRPNAKPIERIPKNEWVIVESCHAPVKSIEEHKQILKNLADRKKSLNRAKTRKYSFSGLIKCAQCGHNHTFYEKRGEIFMKPCWYKDPYGLKCTNKGIKISIIEKIVIDEILRYKDTILTENFSIDDIHVQLNSQIDENKMMLKKEQTALNRINDAYENGDYTKEDWRERKGKREKEIEKIRTEIKRLCEENNQTKTIDSVARFRMISNFLDNISDVADHAERNKLYTTIIESIIWLREGDDIDIKINFK